MCSIKGFGRSLCGLMKLEVDELRASPKDP